MTYIHVYVCSRRVDSLSYRQDSWEIDVPRRTADVSGVRFSCRHCIEIYLPRGCWASQPFTSDAVLPRLRRSFQTRQG